MINPGNRGEWAETYIFLKLSSEGKVYLADANMQRIDNKYLKIIKIIREEEEGEKYEYLIGDPVTILHNEIDEGEKATVSDLVLYTNKTWTLIESSTQRGNSLFDIDIARFLERIHINKLKSPSQSNSEFFGGTEDIIMEVEDYRNAMNSILGFSCKSKFNTEASLFNASCDNTNFRFIITGPIDDSLRDEFNSKYNYKNKVDKETGQRHLVPEVATSERMNLLKNRGCDLVFDKVCVETARRNLIQSGGIEMPGIVAEMLKYYYFINAASTTHENISKALRYLANTDPAGYNMADLEGMYRSKVGHLLFDMFTGMRMASAWSGKQTVTGGYICAKSNGDVVAYHVSVADEFRDFLIRQLSFESPSANRHNYMQIYKDDTNNVYYINLNMQIRFADSEEVKLEKQIEETSLRLTKKQIALQKAQETLIKRQNSNKPNPITITKSRDKVAELINEVSRLQTELDSLNEENTLLLNGEGRY